jgi:cytochrome c-type biogenesis protein
MEEWRLSPRRRALKGARIVFNHGASSLSCLGLGIPFLLSAVLTNRLLGRLKSFGRTGRSLQIGAGGVVVLMGVAMITGQLSAFSYWLLETFPVFQRIG